MDGNMNPDSDGIRPGGSEADPTDDLSRVIRNLCDERDARHDEIDPDDVLREIEAKHRSALLRRGTALARKACRRMITQHLRRVSAMDPESDDGPQFALPGLERLPTHVSYPVPIADTDRVKVISRHTLDATLAQHKACKALKHVNTQRCTEREAQEQRVIDLLEGTGCDTLREYQQRFGQDAA